MTEQTEVHLRIVGESRMQCSGCERTVEFVVSEIAGVRSVTADHETQRIEITAGQDVIQAAQDALASVGYEVDVVEGRDR